MSKLLKTIKLARKRLGEFESVESDSLKKAFDLNKGVHDAMYHHAVHMKGAQAAKYGKEGPASPDHTKKCEEHAKKHEYMLLRHALENAKKKSQYSGGMKYQLQRAMDYFDSESPYGDEHDDHKKAKDHYLKGGDFKCHKDDKFEG